MNQEKLGRVAFVYLPFGACYKPAIGISLLKSALKQQGISADIYYLNLKLAEMVGAEVYDKIACSLPGSLLVGEWLFAPALFGSNPEADRRYVEEFLWNDPSEIFSPSIVYTLLRIRDMIPAYLDACFSGIDWSAYSLVGFSTLFQQQCASLALATRIKEKYPGTDILFGGSQCFGDIGKVLLRLFPCIDYLCTGEGDLAVPALVQALFQGIIEPVIPGILTRHTVLSETIGNKKDSVENLDALPFPDYSDYFSQIAEIDLPSQYENSILMETSRGCWWGEKSPCTFCGLNTEHIAYRYKSPERAFEEIQHLHLTWGKEIIMTDTIMTGEYFKTLLPLLRHLPGVQIAWEMRPHLGKEQIYALYDAGIRNLVLGIESLNDTLLSLMNKGTDLIQILQSLKWAKETALPVTWNMLWGFPGEEPRDYHDIEQLIPGIVHFDPPVQLAHIHYDRWSQYWKTPASYGITRLSPSPVYRLIYPAIPEEDLNQFAYYFDAEFQDRAAEYVPSLVRKIQEWRTNTGARLEMVVSGNDIHIVDERRYGEKIRYDLQGRAAAVYLACDRAQTLDDLTALFEVGAADIVPILHSFIENGLMYASRGKYLSMAVHQRTE